MIENSEEPRKFREQTADDAAAKRLQQLFAGLPTVEAPPKSLFARISARAEERSRSRWLRYALPFGAVIAAGAAAAYVGLASHPRHGLRAPEVQAPLPHGPTDAPPVTVAPPSIPAVLEKTELQQSRPTRKRKPVRADPPPTPTPPSEGEVLAQAVRTLRQTGDSLEALTILNRYFQSFPNGALHGEAQLAEVEALLNLGRSEEALQRLTPERIERMPRSPELFALRGELLVRRGSCVEALKAFAEAEARSPEDLDILERARRGHAACESKSGSAPAPAE